MVKFEMPSIYSSGQVKVSAAIWLRLMIVFLGFILIVLEFRIEEGSFVFRRQWRILTMFSLNSTQPFIHLPFFCIDCLKWFFVYTTEPKRVTIISTSRYSLLSMKKIVERKPYFTFFFNFLFGTICLWNLFFFVPSRKYLPWTQLILSVLCYRWRSFIPSTWVLWNCRLDTINESRVNACE